MQQGDRQDAPVASGREVFVGPQARLLQGIWHYLLAGITPLALAVVSTNIFTRILPPDEYGAYALALSFATILIGLSTAWLQQGVLRHYPEYEAKGRQNQYLLLLGRVAVILSTVSALAGTLFLLVGWAPGTRVAMGLVAMVHVLTAVPVTLFMTVPRAQLRSREFTRLTTWTSLFRFSLSITLLMLFRQPVQLFVGMALANLFNLWLLYRDLPVRTARHGPSWADTWGFARQSLTFGMPLLASTFGAQILQFLDRFMMESYRGTSAVGLYAAHYLVSERLTGLVFAPLIYSAHSLLVRNWTDGRQAETQATLRTATRYVLLVAVPLVGFTSLLSLDFARILLGPAFHSGHEVMPVLVAGLSLWSLAQYGHKGFELESLTTYLALMTTVAALGNALLNALLIPRYGLAGAAWATLLSYLLYAAFVFALTRTRFTSVSLVWQIPWLTLLRCALATVVVYALAALALRQVVGVAPEGIGGSLLRPLLAFLVGAPVYALVLLLLGEAQPREREWVVVMCQRLRARTR